MKKSIKLTLGAVAFAAPVILGVGYTAASASTGDTDGDHSVDQWHIEEDGELTVIDREEIDGAVTIVVSDANGNPVAEADYTNSVVEALAEFGDPNWAPSEVDIFELVDGVGCYDESALQDAGLGFEVTSEDQDGRFELSVDEDGAVAGWYTTNDGAQSLEPCS